MNDFYNDSIINKNNKIKTAVIGGLFFAPAVVNSVIALSAKLRDKRSCEHFYESRLGKIHYTVSGAGKPVLLVHSAGIGSGIDEWCENIDALSEKYKVYAIDLLGYGRSDKPNTTYTAYTYANIINNFIEDVIKSKVAVIGSGQGALFAAMACRINPQNFKKLVLVEPTGVSDTLPKNSDVKIKKLFELPVIGTFMYNIMASRSNIKKFVLNEVVYSKETFIYDGIIDLFYLNAHRGGSKCRYSFASFMSKFMNGNIKTVINEIEKPILIVWGECSKINKIENMEVLTEIKPSAEYLIFENTRLMPHFENPDEFNSEVIEFLGRKN